MQLQLKRETVKEKEVRQLQGLQKASDVARAAATCGNYVAPARLVRVCNIKQKSLFRHRALELACNTLWH